MRCLAFVALACTACNWGTRPHKLAPAVTPAGAWVAVRVMNEPQDRVGELYTVDSIGVIIRTDRLTRIAWRQLYAMDVHKLGLHYDVRPGESPDVAKQRRLAAVSRFPQGLSGELLRRVLALLGQSAVVEVPVGTSDESMREMRRQSSVDALEALADSAARATARYANRRVAIADGYRRVGADFPGMGEHWIHPGVLNACVVDAARPTFLTYAVVEGRAMLLGVGFIAVSDGHSAPRNLAGWPEHWHEHSGMLGEESGARLTVRDTGSASTTRVWVLHVWTRLANPEGRFAADNWALPFARAGVAAPAGVDADIARAWSLHEGGGGDEFLLQTLTDAGLRHAGTVAATDSIVASARAAAHRVAERAMREGRVSESDVAELRLIWKELSVSLGRVLGPSVAALLAPPHRAHGSHGNTGSAPR